MILECISFRLDNELYVHPVSSIIEILHYFEPLPVPGAIDVVAGIINVRGKIVTVISGHVLLHLEHTEPSPDWRIILFESADGLHGITVESVEEILKFEDSNIAGIESSDRNKCIKGTFYHAGGLHVLMDLTFSQLTA